MKRHLRIGSYVAVLVVLISLSMTQSRVWATPAQTHAHQTVPTPTPKGSVLPTAIPPTDVPPTSVPPTSIPPTSAAPTAVVPTASPSTPATAEPTASAIPTQVLPTPTQVASGSQPRLVLLVQASRVAVWTGITVQFTVTLRNEGTVSAKQLTLTNRLPPELQPGTILPVGIASWEAKQFSAHTAVLPPGGALSLQFSATVGATASAGKIIEDVVTVSSTGGPSTTESVFLALPPVELPPVGAKFAGTASRSPTSRAR